MQFILPQQRHTSFPGQVGRFRDALPDAKTAKMMDPSKLNAQYRDVVRQALSVARHELEFRKDVMSWLLENCQDATTRRSMLDKAVRVYRDLPAPQRKYQQQDTVVGSLRKAYGGKYHAKETRPDGKVKYVYAPKDAVPDASAGLQALVARLRIKVREIVARGGEDGFEASALLPLIEKYGANEVTSVLRELGTVTTTGGRVFVAPYKVHTNIKDAHADLLAKASPAQLAGRPSKITPVAGGHAVSNQLGDAAGAVQATEETGRTGTAEMEIGSKRIWDNRILEKKPDGKWHVIGHIAGLEGEAVPSKRTKTARAGGVPLEIRGLTDEQMQFLIDSVKAATKLSRKKDEKK